MWVPLVVLAILSVFGGALNLPHWFPAEGLQGGLHHFLHPVFATASAHLSFEGAPESQEIPLMLVTLVFIAAAVAVAWWMYGAQPDKGRKVVASLPRSVVEGSRNKWYVDEFYEATFVRGIHYLSESWLWKVFDVRIIDGLVNGVARTARWIGTVYGKVVQTGQVQGYAVAIMLGGAALVLFFVLSAVGV